MTSAVCWQFLIKTRQGENQKTKLEININNWKVLPLNRKQATDFILMYEWLGNMGTSKEYFGLFIDGHLASVVCYGPLVAPSHYSRIFGKDISPNMLQLCRGASVFWAPKWAPSKLISNSLKILRQKSNISVVIAYADPEAGEIGTIYQACNAYYLGFTSPGGGKRYIINGHSYDPRKVYKKYGSRAMTHLRSIDPNYSTLPIKPKHRYIFICEKGEKRQKLIEKLQPYLKSNYPKRQDFSNVPLST